MKYYTVKYTGQFGFIKPWTAVRDSETFSQQFLTPSIIAGMERKLFPELLNEPFGIYKIKSYRLSYSQTDGQQEQTQPRGWDNVKVDKKPSLIRKRSIILRNVLLDPVLFLAFDNAEDAKIAASQHLCCCRNEDIMLPTEIIETTNEKFDTDTERFSGFELIFEKNEKSFLVGYNRFDEGKPMYGWLKVLGNPVNSI